MTLLRNSETSQEHHGFDLSATLASQPRSEDMTTSFRNYLECIRSDDDEETCRRNVSDDVARFWRRQ
jgi:hypothetical protein